MSTTTPPASTARVRVWFGPFAIVDFTTTVCQAATQAQGLERRFSGLRVTVDPADASLAPVAGPK